MFIEFKVFLENWGIVLKIQREGFLDQYSGIVYLLILTQWHFCTCSATSLVLLYFTSQCCVLNFKVGRSTAIVLYCPGLLEICKRETFRCKGSDRKHFQNSGGVQYCCFFLILRNNFAETVLIILPSRPQLVLLPQQCCRLLSSQILSCVCILL